MVTHVTEISTPPTPADPPTEFEQKAAKVWSELHQAVPQMNQQADEIEQIGAQAQAAKERAIQESGAALGYRNEARTARDVALPAAVTATDMAAQAVTAKELAEGARDEAQGYAADMGQAVAMAATFTSVPPTFQAWCIAVTQPHLRLMVWGGTKYVRAPWHQPCQLFFSYDNPSSIPGALPVRGDVTWQQADFPDVVERLGLSGSGTFTLAEARGEGVRVLDNGRGVDVGRGLRSAQLDAMQGHWHQSYTGAASSLASMIQGDQLPRDAPVGIKKTVVNNFANEPISDGVNGAPRVSIETRMRNIAFPLWMSF